MKKLTHSRMALVVTGLALTVAVGRPGRGKNNPNDARPGRMHGHMMSGHMGTWGNMGTN